MTTTSCSLMIGVLLTLSTAVCHGQAKLKLSEASLQREISQAEARGFSAGLGYGGLIGGPQLLATAYVPASFGAALLRGSDEGDEGDGTYNMGGAILMVPVVGSTLVAAGLGVAEIVIAAKMVRRNRGPGSNLLVVRRARQAGMARGMGYALMAHGALTSLIAGPLLGAVPDDLMADMFGSATAGKAILATSLGLGLAQLVTGGVLAYTGHSRSAEMLRRTTVAPVAVRGGGGFALAMAW